MSVHLDTHVAIWLAAGQTRRLRPVASVLRASPIFISPVVVVEIQILTEIGRLRGRVSDILDILTADHGVREATGDLGNVARHAQQLGWTRDPFDRLIVAHAVANGATLLTADETILAHSRVARWGK